MELHGRDREAVRWYTIPLTWADDEDLDYLCLMARLRVRTSLGMPVDRFDVLARETRDDARADRSD